MFIVFVHFLHLKGNEGSFLYTQVILQMFYWNQQKVLAVLKTVSHSSWNQKAFKGLTLVSLHDWKKLTGFSSSTKLVKGPLIGLRLLH